MKTRLAISLSVVVAALVVLSSVHVAQLAASAQLDKKAADDTAVKIQTDLHNHVDKAGKVVTDAPQSDARSLRLRDFKRALRNSPVASVLGAWREYITLYLS